MPLESSNSNNRAFINTNYTNTTPTSTKPIRIHLNQSTGRLTIITLIPNNYYIRTCLINIDTTIINIDTTIIKAIEENEYTLIWPNPNKIIYNTNNYLSSNDIIGFNYIGNYYDNIAGLFNYELLEGQELLELLYG